MESMQWYDWMRLVSVFLALIGMYRLTIMFRLRRAQEKVDRRRPEPRLDDFFWVVSAFLLATIIGSLEQIAAGAGYRSASLLTFMITLVTIRATRGHRVPITHL